MSDIKNAYKDNPEALDAIRLISYTSDSVFLTGKAGTGKSTLLRKITSFLRKNFIIVAPTGIAAINVGGQTIHSFFRIAPRPYLPNDKEIEYLTNKIDILKNLDLIVIDEVSMVRADIMNAIDLSLRKNLQSSKPFAGIQLLMIGDLFQLPPVVDSKKLNEVEILGNYSTEYFFSGKAFESTFKFHIVELEKVYRQRDEKFVHLLNAVRESTVKSSDLADLNVRYNPTYQPAVSGEEIILCTTNQLVSDINTERLKSISSQSYVFEAATTGTFDKELNSSRLPADRILTVKVGSQVMFIKNDRGDLRRWVNGSLGKVIALEDSEIVVSISPGNIEHHVEREVWEDIEYVWNKKEETIEQKVVGTFTQFPLKLAWAITIHKSQGQTFDKTVINLGNGAFTTGQTYVALSRCRTFEGITLKSLIRRNDIKVDPKVQYFLDKKRTSEMANEKYQSIISGLESMLDNLQADNRKLVSTKEDSQKKADLALKQLQQVKDEGQRKIKSLNDDIQDMRVDLNHKNQEVSNLRAKNDQLASEVSDLNLQLEQIPSSSNSGYIAAIVMLILVCCLMIYLLLTGTQLKV